MHIDEQLEIAQNASPTSRLSVVRPSVSKHVGCITRCCAKFKSTWVVRNFLKLVLVSENPLPEKPNALDKVKWYSRCPPHDKVAWVLTRLLGLAIALGALYGLVGPENGGPEIYIFVLYITSRIAGFLVSLIGLPPLLGMLLAGIGISNVNHALEISEDIDAYWKEVLRDIAFITILVRAGLSLNPKGLIQMSWVVVRLAFLPGVITEGPVVAIMAHLLLDLPILWSFMLGFILAAVSPAVVVPSLLTLQSGGYGVDKEVPTLIIAAASIDDIIAISAFSVTLSITFADAESGILIEILRAPLEVVLGVLAALLVGVVLWYIPPTVKNETKNKGGNPVLENHKTARFLLMFGSGIAFMFGARKLDLSGAGALGTLCVAFFTGLGWDTSTKIPVCDMFGHAWKALMPLLFGLIGSEIELKVLAHNPKLIISSLVVIGCGLAARFLASFIAVVRANLNVKEKIFVGIAWLPKATVQAAMGTIPLDIARGHLEKALHHEQMVSDMEAMRLSSNNTMSNSTMAAVPESSSHRDVPQATKDVKFGTIVITVAVLAILISAPLGAVGISLTGKKLLSPTRRRQRRSLTPRNGGETVPCPSTGATQGTIDEEFEMLDVTHNHKNDPDSNC